jgi:hypothetical protein
MENQNRFLARRVSGLTVVEVLFSMVIVLVGLLGIAAIVPFAARQAEDSYKIAQALTAGESALDLLNSQSIVKPRLDAQWQFVEDEFAVRDSDFSVAKSWNDFYIGNEYANRLNNLRTNGVIVAPFDTVANRILLSRLQNQVIGTGFCIDPLFWGYQERGPQIVRSSRGNFRRTRFPFYDELMPANFNPFFSSVGGSDTPRLRRISMRDPLGSNVGGNSGWLRLPAAIRLATISGGDIIQAKPEVDRSAGPLRGQYIDGFGALLQSPTSATSVSWLATLTPSDITPIITPESLNFVGALPSIETVPENYDLSVVVFSKRDVRESLNPATGIVPVSERFGGFVPLVVDPATSPPTLNMEFLTSGTFDFEIASAAGVVDPKIKIGDWLMLSRNIFDNPYVQTGAAAVKARERHKWYRVISVSDGDDFPKQVRVSGQPWDWTAFEVAVISAAMKSDPTLGFPSIPATAVTLLKDVVQVYRRSVSLQSL